MSSSKYWDDMRKHAMKSAFDIDAIPEKWKPLYNCLACALEQRCSLCGAVNSKDGSCNLQKLYGRKGCKRGFQKCIAWKWRKALEDVSGQKASALLACPFPLERKNMQGGEK